MELRIEPDGKTAVSIADVARGWRRLTNTYGFCEEAKLEILGDKVLRVQASIRAWPNVFGSRLFRYPQSVYGLLKTEWGRAELREKQLQIAIDVPTIAVLRLRRSGLPGIYQPPTEMDKQGRVGLWLSLLVVLQDRAKTEYPDIVEWDTQFLSGGRPGSSRHH